MKSRIVLIGLIACSIVTTVFIMTVSADVPPIPQWIRNNAKWWAEGSISDSEFLKGIQYLVQNGIIQVQGPVTLVTATNGIPSDSDRVMSMVINFSNIENVPDSPANFTINTIQRLYELNQPASTYVEGSSVPVPTKFSPAFQLVDLPSKDKLLYYQFIHSALEGQSRAYSEQPIADVGIALYTGDGTLLDTLNYDRCNVNAYWVDTDSNKNDYRIVPTNQAWTYSENQTEFREYANFVCQGYHLLLPNGASSP